MTTSLIGMRPANDGFTLIELILVLALLAGILALAAPSLSRFYGGRALESEARRLLTLTRYGGEQAINEGVPLELWIFPDENRYGLRPQIGWATNRHNSLDFLLQEGLTLAAEATNRLQRTDPVIRFLPDGSITEDSLAALQLENRKQDQVRIVRSRFGTRYEIAEPR